MDRCPLHTAREGRSTASTIHHLILPEGLEANVKARMLVKKEVLTDEATMKEF